MTEGPGRLREVAWSEILPWICLFRAYRIAFQAKMLLLGWLGVLAMLGGWRLVAWVFSGTDDPHLSSWVAEYSPAWSDVAVGTGSLYQAGSSLTESDLFGGPALTSWADSPLTSAWRTLSAPIRQLFSPHVSLTSLAFLVLVGLWSLAVWSLCAGAMTRIAAVQVTREQRIGLRQALAFARRKWWAYFAAPLFPLLGVFMSSLPLLLAGLFMRWDFGALLTALIWPLFLLGGVLMTIMLAGLLWGWPLMWPTISTEGLDSFDGLNHAYSYAFQRPLQYLSYGCVALLLSAVAGFVVTFFAETVLYVPAWAASWGSGNLALAQGASDAEEPGWALRNATWTFNAWATLVRLVAVGAVHSFFWTSATMIYLLLRRDTDRTEMHEISLDDPLDTAPSGAAGDDLVEPGAEIPPPLPARTAAASAIEVASPATDDPIVP